MTIIYTLISAACFATGVLCVDCAGKAAEDHKSGMYYYFLGWAIVCFFGAVGFIRWGFK